jgi:hypothetical protein
MHPLNKIGAESFWNCQELSPADLLKSLEPQRSAVNQDEYSRAEWFWQRRPKVLFQNITCLFCYVVVLVCLIYSVPDSWLSLLVWLVAGASCSFVEWLRLDRWRSEYGSSLNRVLLARGDANKQTGNQGPDRPEWR